MSDAKSENYRQQKRSIDSLIPTPDHSYVTIDYNSGNIIKERIVKQSTEHIEKQALKLDSGKTEYHYISPIFMEQLSRVLTFGAKKYAAHNWRSGFKWSRVLSACFRHIYAWMGGQDKDPETGISHLAHAACCLMFLLEFEETHRELDDRWKPEVKEN